MANEERVSEVIERTERRVSVSAAEARRVGPILREARKAERKAGDGSEVGGTGFTVLKFSASPVARLIDRGKIGGEEVMAADEIQKVFMAISGALLLRPPSMEWRDKGQSPPEPSWLIDAQERYRQFANYWSARGKRGDPTLEIVIAAVVDERPLWTLDDDLRIRSGRAEKALIAALRDYAARAGWVAKGVAASWLGGSSSIFKLRSTRA